MRAIFTPRRTDDIRAEALDLIGKTLTLRYAFTLDKDESKFPGQRVYTIDESDAHYSKYPWWIPESELQKLIQLVDGEGNPIGELPEEQANRLIAGEAVDLRDPKTHVPHMGDTYDPWFVVKKVWTDGELTVVLTKG